MTTQLSLGALNHLVLASEVSITRNVRRRSLKNIIPKLFEEILDSFFRYRGWQCHNFEAIDGVKVDTTIKKLHGEKLHHFFGPAQIWKRMVNRFPEERRQLREP